MKKAQLLLFICFIIQPFIFSQENASVIIGKYAKNIGGKKAWQKIKSFKIGLTGKIGENEFESSQYMLKPNCFKVIFKYPNNERILSYNGSKGYISNNKTVKEMPKGMETEMHEEADFFDELILYKEKGYKPSLEKDTIIDNKEYYKISLYKNTKDTHWYYINKSNYLVEIVEEYSEEKKWKGILFKTILNNYQKTDNVLLPSTMLLYANNKLVTEYKINKVILNMPLTLSHFTLNE